MREVIPHLLAIDIHLTMSDLATLIAALVTFINNGEMTKAVASSPANFSIIQDQIETIELHLDAITGAMAAAKLSALSLASGSAEAAPKAAKSSLGYVPKTIFRKYAYPWVASEDVNLPIRKQFTEHFERVVATKYPEAARTAIEPTLASLRADTFLATEAERTLLVEDRLDQLFGKFFNTAGQKKYGNLNALFFEDAAVAAFLDANKVCPKHSFVEALASAK
jgi:hypothetical protein